MARKRFDEYDPARDVAAPKACGTARELNSKTGAAQLAAELNHWWHSRGYPEVQHWIESFRAASHRRAGRIDTIETDHDDRRLWCVKSNLVNGLPPKPSKEQRHGYTDTDTESNWAQWHQNYLDRWPEQTDVGRPGRSGEASRDVEGGERVE